MKGAVFVLPATTAGEQGPVAAWVSTAGWAAARRVLGKSWIVGPSGLVEPLTRANEVRGATWRAIPCQRGDDTFRLSRRPR